MWELPKSDSKASSLIGCSLGTISAPIILERVSFVGGMVV